LTIILNTLRIVLMRSMVLLALPVALTAAGCSALTEDQPGVQVATAFYPLEFVAERVTEGVPDVGVEVLTEPGKEPHDVELTIKETALIASADLVVYEKDFQPAVDDAIDQNAAGDTLDVSGPADLVTFESEHDHEEGDEHGHSHEGLDPAGLRADLEALDAAYTSGLADCERDTVVVSHDAFGYLSRYGVHIAAIAGLSPEAEPTPSDLAELHELIEHDGITTVFSETLAPPKLSQTLADDAGVTTDILDPVEGLTDDTADEDYLSLMERNLAALEEANGCR
jgi:zinc transport system substrate-binding protein